MPQREQKPATSTWRLWVDRCGGFELKVGDRWTVGGDRPDSSAAIRVQSDWHRNEGEIVRREGEYFWMPADEDDSDNEYFIRSGEALPIAGSATMQLSVPSRLSRTAVLSVLPPHRIGGHVDAILLVDRTILVGPGSENHVRCPSPDDSLVILFRDGRWQAKRKPSFAAPENRRELTEKPNAFVELAPGRRVSIGQLDMTLEQT